MQLRSLATALTAAATILGGSIIAGAGAAGAAASPVSLVVSQSVAFGALGHSCGGIQEQVFATGFDPVSSFPEGAAHLSTTCSSGGRGSHPATFTAWVGAEWDYAGSEVTSSTLSSVPELNPTLSVTDGHGNLLYNHANSAFLVLAANFVPTPTLATLSVAQGPAKGGTSVTITGTGFGATTAVDFGGSAAASYTVNGDTSITATTPASSPGTVDVKVSTAGGTSASDATDEFTFVAAPTINSVSPNSGPLGGGTTVTITGTGFSATTEVLFGAVAAKSFTVVSPTSIVAVSPPQAAELHNIFVTTPIGTSALAPADEFDYL